MEAAAAPDDHDMDTRAVEKTPSSPFSFQNTLAGETPYRVAPSSSVSPRNRDVGTASVGAGVESPFSKYINYVTRSAPTSDIKHVPAYAPSLGVISSAEKGLLEPHSGLASNPYLPRSATATPALDRKEAKDDGV